MRTFTSVNNPGGADMNTGVRTLLVCTIVALVGGHAPAADAPRQYRGWPTAATAGQRLAWELVGQLRDERRTVEERVEIFLEIPEAFRRRAGERAELGPVLDELEALAGSPQRGPAALRGAARAVLAELPPARVGRPRAIDSRDRVVRSSDALLAARDLVERPGATNRQTFDHFRTMEGFRADAVGELLKHLHPHADVGVRRRAEWVLWCLVGPAEAGAWAEIAGREDPAVTDVTKDERLLQSYWTDAITEDGPAYARAVAVSRTCEGVLRRAGLGTMTARSGGREAVARRAGAIRRNLASSSGRPVEAADVAAMTSEARTGRFTPAGVGAYYRGSVARQGVLSGTELSGAILDYGRRLFEPDANGRPTDRLKPAAAAAMAAAALGWDHWPDGRRSAVDSRDAAQRRIDQELEKTAGPARDAAVRHFALAASLGEGRAAERLRAWKAGDAPVVRAALAVGAGPRVPLAVRAWIARAVVGPPDGGERLAKLLTHDDPDVRKIAATVAGAGGQALDAEPALVWAIKLGRPIGVDVVAALRVTPSDSLKKQLVAYLDGTSLPLRRSALEVIAATGVADDALRATLRTKFLRSADAAERDLAAAGIGTDDARRVARIPSLIAELRGHSPERRARAARELQSIDAAAPAVSRALLKAVDAGDFAVREGLVIALQAAWERDVPAEQVLAGADAEPDAARRAYLRAARRAVGQAPPPPPSP